MGAAARFGLLRSWDSLRRVLLLEGSTRCEDLVDGRRSHVVEECFEEAAHAGAVGHRHCRAPGLLITVT